MDETERNKTEGDGADQTPSLGQVLKAGRTARGLTLEQMSTELRIEVRQLHALEEDQFERIGPPVFVKGYVRHYAQRVGLDYGDLLSLYYKQAENREVPVQPSRSIMLRDERQITVWIVAALVLVAVLVALAVWWLTRSTAVPARGFAHSRRSGAACRATAADRRCFAQGRARAGRGCGVSTRRRDAGLARPGGTAAARGPGAAEYARRPAERGRAAAARAHTLLRRGKLGRNKRCAW